MGKRVICGWGRIIIITVQCSIVYNQWDFIRSILTSLLYCRDFKDLLDLVVQRDIRLLLLRDTIIFHPTFLTMTGVPRPSWSDGGSWTQGTICMTYMLAWCPLSFTPCCLPQGPDGPKGSTGPMGTPV